MDNEKPRRSKKEQNRIRKNPIAVAHSKRGGAGAGSHVNRRKPKHRKSWYSEYQDWQDELEE